MGESNIRIFLEDNFRGTLLIISQDDNLRRVSGEPKENLDRI